MKTEATRSLQGNVFPRGLQNKEFGKMTPTGGRENHIESGHFKMATDRNIAVGSKVWVEDSKLAWVEAEVSEVINGQAKVVTGSGNKLSTPIFKAHPRDPDAKHGGVDDMTKLAYLNEPGVLYNLARRYELNDIYTYTGSILIAVNPFTKLPHLYNIHMMEQYRGAPFGELSPHVFAVADTSYRAMINEARSQSILVSGESGAGKTETTKLIMQYLAYMGGRAAIDNRTVEQQVLESNPLLEAFGNAKTVRNDNSSRFGKFVEIQFDKNGRISGAAIRTYLLERSRVVQITDPERNYHCFYQLCASPEDVEKYKLGDPRTLHYLNQSRAYELCGVSNAREYVKTRRAMDIVGINLDEQEAIFRTLAAILHLGNVEFAPGREHDSSILKDQESNFHLQTAAELFMCDAKALQDTLCTRIIVTREGNIMKTLDPSAAVTNRDALAKTVYSRLFDWLVDKINKSIGQDPDSKTQIGVLDIYGFESFKNNSFEQFCINLANEKLQQHFNQHVFKMEQDDYSKEEINWSYIEFIDNQDVLDLIEKKPVGIIALLDEACMFPKSTNETFATKLFQNFGNHHRFKKPKLARTDFTISHYAGEVTYQTDLFLEKNRDYIVVEHHTLLSSSKCFFVAGLFPPLREDSSKSSYKFSSIATRFKQQLQALLETLSSTEPHYIRCVKPNADNKPGHFENQSVLHQLRCGGVLEAIRISCAGYPTRRTYDEFLDRFGLLAPEIIDGNYDEKTATEKLLQKLNLSNYQLGKTKVFLRAGQIVELDARRAEALNNAAKVIQRKLRTFIARKEFIRKCKAAVTIQTYCRGCLARKFYDIIRREAAAVLIQKHTRRCLVRRAYTDLLSAVIIIQAGIRASFARQEYYLKKKTIAAIIIQKQWHMWKAHSYFSKLRGAAITLQCAWRCRIARIELRKLKVAARETGALREAKNKLEKRCEDLTWRLELEKRLRTASEEAKTLEVMKLQNALQGMQAQLHTANANILKKQEENKILHSQLQIVSREKSVLETSEANIQELRRENEHLKASTESFQKKTSEMQRELIRAQKEIAEWQRKAEEAESKFMRTKQILQRFEEKNSNVDHEKQVLRQQAIVISPTNGLTNVVKPIIMQKNPEVHQISNGDQKSRFDSPMSSQKFREFNHTPGESRRSKIMIERQQENQELLLKCVKENLGFSNDKPVAACIIYKCLLQWHLFEAERTTIFDCLIQAILTEIEGQDNNIALSYWLSNTSTLLFLLQRNLRSNGFPSTPQHRLNASMTFMGRMTQSFRSPSNFVSPGAVGSFGDLEGIRQVEAKYPALLFKQQLTAALEKVYGLIRDNVKKEITPLLSLCIQAPRSSRTSMSKGSRSPNVGGASQQVLSSHWHSIIKILNSLLNMLRANHVPPFFISKLFTQVFSFINGQLFNSLLLRRECCSFSNGEYVKSGLAELERWICEASEKYAGTSWHELRYIRQAVGFLVIHQKRKKSLDEILHDLCPVLSIQQLYRISTMYWDDKYGTQSVSNEVISSMREIVQNDSHNFLNNSFLLDDDLSIPFSADDISNTIGQIDLSDVEPPPLLREVPTFHFLLRHSE
eukprot:Gb_30020 [translate_table: standard]